jgi:hypothetical protein
LTTLRSRLPATYDILLTFIAIVFPIHMQAFIGWMVLVPSLIKRYTLWDTIGVVSYIHVFALIESISLLFVLVFLAVLLPEKYYRSQFVALSTMFIFITVPFLFVIKLFVKYRAINLKLLTVLLVYGVLFWFLYRLIMRNKRMSKIFLNLTSVLTILSIFYVFVDLITIFVLFVRKIGI